MSIVPRRVACTAWYDKNGQRLENVETLPFQKEVLGNAKVLIVGKGQSATMAQSHQEVPSHTKAF